jgi:hypothetical protein
MNDLNADQQSCAAWIARFLKARGIDRIFGLQGGHIQPIWDHVARQGIRIIDVRDEGAGVVAGNIERSRIDEVRQSLPAWRHRVLS